MACFRPAARQLLQEVGDPEKALAMALARVTGFSAVKVGLPVTSSLRHSYTSLKALMPMYAQDPSLLLPVAELPLEQPSEACLLPLRPASTFGHIPQEDP